MNNKILTLAISMIFLLTIMPFVSAELSLWNTVIKDKDNSIVRNHLYYWFDDTSATGIGKNKNIPITFYYVIQALPYSLTGGQVDWCNLTLTHYMNIYNEKGEFLNETKEVQSLYFSGTPLTSGQIVMNMKSRDSVIGDIDCHYTDVNYLYQENALIGRWTTFLPSFECNKCEQYTLEDLSNQIEKNEEITANELTIYDNIQKALGWNFQIWLIISWIIKIGFVLVGLGLIFYGGYYFYKFLMDIGKTV